MPRIRFSGKFLRLQRLLVFNLELTGDFVKIMPFPTFFEGYLKFLAKDKKPNIFIRSFNLNPQEK